MRSFWVLVALLATPSVCFAHSGAVARVVLNYIPLLLAIVPLASSGASKLATRCKTVWKKTKRRQQGG